MKIKELHNDIERYLKYDCYCPNEIYDLTGRFYNTFYAEQECVLIGKTTDGNDLKLEQIWCVAFPDNDDSEKPQIICFGMYADKCMDSIRIDATDNNIKEVKELCIKGIGNYKIKIDEYKKGATVKSLKEVLDIVGAIRID